MPRTSVIGEVFGYLVCLLAVVIFFISVAGIVNGAFRVANPTAGPRVIGGAMIGGPEHRGGNFFFRTRGGPPPPGAPDVATMRANFAGDARFEAIRRLVLALVMFGLSIAVFRAAFSWLNPKQASGGGT